MGELVLEIGVTGKTRAMHSDKFDLGFLGDKTIRRQTEILFSEKTQQWDIVYICPNGSQIWNKAIAGFDGYEEARTFEVDWLNRCRLYDLPPHHALGLAYAQWLRTGDHTECFTLPDGDCISEHCMHVPK